MVARNVPLNIVSTRDGKASVDKGILLKEREMKVSLDTSRPFKLNAGTTGVCTYLPSRTSLTECHSIGLLILSFPRSRVLYTGTPQENCRRGEQARLGVHARRPDGLDPGRLRACAGKLYAAQ